MVSTANSSYAFRLRLDAYRSRRCGHSLRHQEGRQVQVRFCILLTVLTIFIFRSKAIQLLLAFSFTRNAPKLVQMPKDAQSTISCMFGLRFLSMAVTLIGHSAIFVECWDGWSRD